MSHADRLPIIIYAAQGVAEEANDLLLAAGLSMAVSFADVAPLLPVTAEDIEQARLVVDCIRGDEGPRTVITARVAGHLASTAAFLRATDDAAYDELIERMWSAATALMGRQVRPGLRAVT